MEFLRPSRGAHARTVALVLAILGFTLGLPSLRGGLQTLDDPAQQRTIADHLSGRGSSSEPWWDLYNLVDGDPQKAILATLGWARPWWAWPWVKIRFFRPVAAATLYLDAILFGEHHWLAHLHSDCWYLAACFCVALLVIQLSQHRSAAVLGAFLFVVDDAHSAPVGWLACRNSLIAVTFSCVALLLYDKNARSDRLAWAFGAAGCMLAALLAAENATSAAPLFLSYSCFLDRRAFRRRATSLSILALAVSGWLLWYRSAGFGSKDSGAYLDPLRDGAAFWSVFIDRYAALLRIQFGAPWALNAFVPLPVLQGIDSVGRWLALPALLVWVVRSIDKDREVAFWFGALVLGMAALVPAFPHERLLAHVGIAAWMLVALFVRALWRWTRTRSRSMRTAVAALVALPASSYAIGAPAALALGSGPPNLSILEGKVLDSDPALARRSLLVVNALNLMLPLELLTERTRQHLASPARMTVFGTTEHEVEVIRLDEHTFELYSAPGYILDPFASFWRGPTVPMTPGYQVTLQDYEVQVVRVTPDGRPLRVRFRFKASLDDDSLRFVYFSGFELKDFHFAAVGRRRIIPANGDTRAEPVEE